MIRFDFRIARWPAATAILAAVPAFASDLDVLGLTLLNQATTNLNGSGVSIVQVEAPVSAGSPPPFEVNPASLGLATSNFTYFVGPPVFLTPASSSTFPNSLGSESGHASAVGNYFYGPAAGISTNVLHIDNYEASYFFLTVVPSQLPLDGRIVNQSFIAPTANLTQQQLYNSDYDNYAALRNTLFISGVGNGGAVNPPSTCYNGIGVGAYGGASSVGPTPENGRAKPDIVAPGSVTSFTTPRVSGAAAILLQAGLRGDGGADTNAAVDSRTLKALLLNGAVKPSDWSAPSPSPLDPRYGTGVLNVFNSYNQMAGGKRSFIEYSSVATGGAHPPLSATGAVSNLSGWDFNVISNNALIDGIGHYYFDLPARGSSDDYTATITIVWNRQPSETAINNLDLFLYDALSGNLIGASTSVVDNVEHLHVLNLPPGRYDLQVLKRGGTCVSFSETYALAFEFFSMPLTIARSGNGIALIWPDYPAGFVLQTTSSFTGSGSWYPVDLSPTVTNRQNVLQVQPLLGSQFFRLARP